MTVKKEKTGDTLLISVEGAIDINTSPQLQAELDGELDDINLIIFDLRESTYTSSSGLRVMLGTYQIMEKKGGRMILRNVNKLFYDILKMSGFTDFIEIESA